MINYTNSRNQKKKLIYQTKGKKDYIEIDKGDDNNTTSCTAQN